MTRRLLAPGAVAAVCAVWAALALANPTLTYHFASIVAAAVGPFVHRTRSGRSVRRTALTVAGAGLALVAVTSVALWAADSLRGPTFWTDDGAVVEALAFAVVGSAYGVRVLTRARGGLFA